MTIEIKAWLFSLLVGFMILNLIGGVYLYHKHSVASVALAEEKHENQALKDGIEASKKNVPGLVTSQTKAFLKAFLESDSTKSEPVEKRIMPYTTERARQQVIIPGQNETPSKIPVVSKLKELKVYHTAVKPDKASVYVTAKREISVNKQKPVDSKTVMELELKLDGDNWIVDNIELIQ